LTNKPLERRSSGADDPAADDDEVEALAYEPFECVVARQV
jgi:hypothetical protein